MVYFHCCWCDWFNAVKQSWKNVEIAAPPGSEKHFPYQLHEAKEVPSDICHGNKLKSVKSCPVCHQASYCELHPTSHERDPALQRHRLTDPATTTSPWWWSGRETTCLFVWNERWITNTMRPSPWRKRAGRSRWGHRLKIICTNLQENHVMFLYVVILKFDYQLSHSLKTFFLKAIKYFLSTPDFLVHFFIVFCRLI